MLSLDLYSICYDFLFGKRVYITTLLRYYFTAVFHTIEPIDAFIIELKVVLRPDLRPV